jgi:hypothetical protein
VCRPLKKVNVSGRRRGPSCCNNVILFIKRSYHDLAAPRGQCFVCEGEGENNADFVHLAGVTRTTGRRDGRPITSRDLWGRSSRGSPVVPVIALFSCERIWNYEHYDLMVCDAVKFGRKGNVMRSSSF